MIHIVTAENCSFYRAQIVEMHRQRKALFVDDMNWQLEVRDGLEIDPYDGPDAIYLLLLNPSGRVFASARLLPTTAPHLLSDIFPHLCERAVPRLDTIWEASRFCPAPTTPKGEPRRLLLGQIIAGILEAGMLFGIGQVSYVASAALAPLAQTAGWDVEPLGASARYRRERVRAFIADLSSAGLAAVRAKYALRGPVIRYVTELQGIAA